MTGSRCGRAGVADGYPGIGTGIIFAPGIRGTAALLPSPDNHSIAGPDCGVTVSRGRCISGTRRGPGVCAGIVSAAGIRKAGDKASPDNHLTASPYCSMKGSPSGRVGGAYRDPGIRGRVVPGTAVLGVAEAVGSAPNDHFGAGPDCCMSHSCGGPIGCIQGSPGVCGWVISPTSVEIAAVAAFASPNDHFTARPNCGVSGPGRRRVRRVGNNPCISAPRCRSGRRRRCRRWGWSCCWRGL